MVQKLFQYQRFYHVIFWMACFFILFRLFTKDYYNGIIDYIYTGLFIIPMIVIVYLNRWLVDQAINKKNSLLYLGGFIGLVALSIGLHYVVYEFLTDIIFSSFFIASYFTIWEIVQYSVVFLLVSTLLKLAKDWFVVKDKAMSLMQENHQVQLSSLKSRINPHFLFNSLNNIYALSNDSPEAVRNYILKLSDALRYMIYETDEDLVILQDELDYLSDYIALEKLRMSTPEKINYSFPNDVSELIAPMLLLPIVENCFKHVDKKSPFIDIIIEIAGTHLTMTSRNTFQVQSEGAVGGLGIDNLRKRLQLLYPNKHHLEASRKDGIYTSHMTIDLIQ